MYDILEAGGGSAILLSLDIRMVYDIIPDAIDYALGTDTTLEFSERPCANIKNF